MKFQFSAKIKDGKPKIGDRSYFDQVINSLEGKDITISIEKKKKQRSCPQNRFYWGCVIPILKAALKETGNIFSNEQVHDLLKFKFLKEDLPISEDGEFIERIKSTTELTTSEFMDYISEIQRWSAEFLGVTIPDPNEQLTLNA